MPADLVIGQDRGHDIASALPLVDQGDIESIALGISGNLRMSVGLERMLDAPSYRRALGPGGHRVPLVLTGQPVGAALDRIFAEPLSLGTSAVRYKAHWGTETPVLHVTPFGDQPTFLDTVVPSFELKDVAFSQAIADVHRLLDPTYPAVQGGSMGSVGGSANTPKFSEEPWHQLVSVSLHDVTVRNILDALVRAHGDGSWVVRYRSAQGEYWGCEIAFATSDGAAYTLLARKR